MKRLRLASFLCMVAAMAVAGYFYRAQILAGDENAPVVTAPEEVLTVSVRDGEDKLLEGVTATDEKDGDVSDTLVVESISSFTDDHRRLVTIAAFDENKNVGKTVRQITYSDYQSPRFEILQPLVLIEKSDVDYMNYFAASDSADGDISGNIRISYDVYFDSYAEGTYTSEMEVSNSIGDVVKLPFTYEVYDQTTYNKMPKIDLSQYIVYTGIGKKVDPSRYIKEIRMSGYDKEEDTVDIDESAVDYNKAGTYEIVYSIRNDDDLVGKSRLIVVVEE